MTESKMFELAYGFWFGLIGMVTGSAGLILHFWRYLQEKPRISIHVPSGSKGRVRLGSVRDRQLTNEFNEPILDKTRCFLYLWARISNHSDKPITILEYELRVPKHGGLLSDSDSECYASTKQ